MFHSILASRVILNVRMVALLDHVGISSMKTLSGLRFSDRVAHNGDLAYTHEVPSPSGSEEFSSNFGTNNHTSM